MQLVVKYVKSQVPLINDLEGDANVESDCDEDTAGAKDGPTNVKEEKEENRAVLIVGSLSA